MIHSVIAITQFQGLLNILIYSENNYSGQFAELFKQ